MRRGRQSGAEGPVSRPNNQPRGSAPSALSESEEDEYLADVFSQPSPEVDTLVQPSPEEECGV